MTLLPVGKGKEKKESSPNAESFFFLYRPLRDPACSGVCKASNHHPRNRMGEGNAGPAVSALTADLGLEPNKDTTVSKLQQLLLARCAVYLIGCRVRLSLLILVTYSSFCSDTQITSEN